ncbi:uncharacterized protein LOC132176692 isoform X3 [Corylus avellana]|uniref:uncharacterized protein LOC132176692 isoform X3 n=1 Tax=Corylus avellana TaxID=13451 RepID=UPI00286B83B4|nr:uncharacterized protein LOC132176692 isoform X3 [Corylus avellana]
MNCFPEKVMATVVAIFLLVGGIHIPPTSASLPHGGRKSLTLDGSTKTVPRLQGSFEGLHYASSFSSKGDGNTSSTTLPSCGRYSINFCITSLLWWSEVFIA